MSGILYVNDVDIETEICQSRVALRRLPPTWSAGISYSRNMVQLPGLLSSAVAPNAIAQPRVLDIDLVLYATTPALRDSDVALLLDTFGRDMIELRTGDNTSKVLDGYLTQHSLTAVDDAAAMTLGYSFVSLQVTCPDPSKRDRFTRGVSFGSTATSILLGTQPSAGIIRIMGAATNPVITYRDSGGTSQGSMTFTVTLAGTEYLEIDLALKTVKKYASGTMSDAISTWTAGDFFVTDPAHGSYALFGQPTLTCSSGTAIYVYTRRWDN